MDSYKINKLKFDEDFPQFWETYILSSCIGKVYISNLYPPLMNLRKEFEEDEFSSLTDDEYTENCLFHMNSTSDDECILDPLEIEPENEEDICETEKMQKDVIDENMAKDIFEKYSKFKIDHVKISKNEEFKLLDAEFNDNSMIFTEKIKGCTIDETVSNFLIRMKIEHPSVLPLKGFSVRNSKMTKINLYRESNEKLYPIKDKRMINASNMQKIKWMKQIADVIWYLLENFNCKIEAQYLEEYAVMGPDNNIVFVNLNFIKCCSEDEDVLESSISGFTDLIDGFFEENDHISSKMSYIEELIQEKKRKHKDYSCFSMIKDYLDNNENNDPIGTDVSNYLSEYYIEKEIKGHQCNVKIYMRNPISDKKFRRLVLKKYDFVFNKNLRTLLQKIKHDKENIIESWVTEKESFILMKFIDAQRLRDLLPSLNYDQKIEILLKIADFIDDSDICFPDLSIDNVYLNEEYEVKLVDCIFIADNCESPLIAPEVKNLNEVEDDDKKRISVFSLGNIAYEMFGGIINKNYDFNFDEMPKFVEYLVKLCCRENYIFRASPRVVKDKLEKYKDQDADELFRNEFIDFSQYYIDKKDLKKVQIGNKKVIFQLSTKKYLIKGFSSSNSNFFNDVQNYIAALQNRNCLPLYCISFDNRTYNFYFERTGDVIGKNFRGLSLSQKYEIFMKTSQFADEMLKIGLEVNIKGFKYMIMPNDEIKIIPKLSNDSDKKLIKQFANKMCDAFNPDLEGYKKISHETPYMIQALVWRMVTGEPEKRASFSQITKVFERMNDTLLSDFNGINWDKEDGNLDNEDKYMVYKSDKNPDFVEEGIRVEILLASSELFSYVRNDNKFALFYHGKCDKQFKNHLYNIENLSIIGYRVKNKTKGFRIEREYQGKHYLVQFLVKDDKKFVLKKCNKNYMKMKLEEDWGIKSRIWEENDEKYILQNYLDVVTLEDFISKKDFTKREKMAKKIIHKIFHDFYHKCYNRYSTHNICIEKDKSIKYVDNVNLDKRNYQEFQDEFTAPECSRYPELSSEERKNAVVYSAGWIAYILLGNSPEIDDSTKKFKSPVFYDDFPEFWRDFITLTTREHLLDRPSYEKVKQVEKGEASFDEVDFFMISSMLLNHDDFLISDPIGVGGEAVIYLATNKLTGEVHACKKLKQELNSYKVKKIFLTISKLGNANYGMKYLGISIKDRRTFIHMEYVPNGSLSDVITASRQLKPPAWFNEATKLRIAKEIAEGMLELHEKNIIHRDLKPENILLDENNCVKICDFSFIPEESKSTILFMAPEIFSGEDPTFKSDVYSYAVTLSCLFGGGDTIGSVKTATIGGFRPSIAISTPSSIQSLIRKCWQQNPADRPTFSEIIDELDRSDLDEDNLKIKSMVEFPNFDPNKRKGILSERYEYEICDVADDMDNVEHLVRLHITIQPENMFHIHKYCKFEDKIILIIENSERLTFETYLNQKKKVSSSKGEKYVSDFISIFELYHNNGFHFGPFSLNRIFFRNKHHSSICFDLFMITGLSRPQSYDDVLIEPPEKDGLTRESDSFAFACFVLKMFNCLDFGADGKISLSPFKKRTSPLPAKCRNIIIPKCLSPEKSKRPTFRLLFQKLFSTQYNIISTFLSVSVSRFSTFSMKKDFKKEEIEFLNELGVGSF